LNEWTYEETPARINLKHYERTLYYYEISMTEIIRRTLLGPKQRSSLVLAAVLAAVLLACPALARVSGPCSNCHTMHNSQDGTSMAVTSTGAPDATPNAELLKTDCLGCHSANDGGTWKNSVGAPIVYNTIQPTYGPDPAEDGKSQGLAGGNFYWVTQDDSFGHNIFSPDASLAIAPGEYYGTYYGCGAGSDSCHANFDRTHPASGARQCQGCHMIADVVSGEKNSWHHADDSATVTDSKAQGWYRFLGGHASTVGVKGIEDPDWEHAVDPWTHNEYLGVVSQGNGAAALSALKTMSSFCIGCHANFHVQSAGWSEGDPWLKHPADAVLPNEGDYQAVISWDPITPVARPALSAVSSNVSPGQDMVMCLSCHRPHASPYPDMLRFPYDRMLAGMEENLYLTGCLFCHRGKGVEPPRAGFE